MGPRTARSMDLVREHGIAPNRCSRCRCATNWSAPTVDGDDRKKDTGDLIWQCNACGQIDSLGAKWIRTRAKQAAGR